MAGCSPQPPMTGVCSGMGRFETRPQDRRTPAELNALRLRGPTANRWTPAPATDRQSRTPSTGEEGFSSRGTTAVSGIAITEEGYVIATCDGTRSSVEFADRPPDQHVGRPRRTQNRLGLPPPRRKSSTVGWTHHPQCGFLDGDALWNETGEDGDRGRSTAGHGSAPVHAPRRPFPRFPTTKRVPLLEPGSLDFGIPVTAKS